MNPQQPESPTPPEIFNNEQVVGVLLENGVKLKVKKGTYKEYRMSEEIYVAEVDSIGHENQKVVGPTRKIMALYFVDN